MKNSTLTRGLIVTAALLCLLSVAVDALAWNFKIPAQEVRPQSKSFVFPTAAFEDGRAKHFVYKHSPSQWIRFFIVKSADGVIRAAFDACDVCFKSKKGYVQNGNDMVCINCGLKFKTEKINEIKGGCNPAPLKRSVNGSNLVLTKQDVLSGLRYFE